MDKRAKTGEGLAPVLIADDLDALDLLRAQHRAIDLLFRAVQSTKGTTKATSWRELTDMLVVHATIEEWIFYPGVRSVETEELLAESTEEHLAMKRTLADMLDDDVSGDTFDAKLSVFTGPVFRDDDPPYRGVNVPRKFWKIAAWTNEAELGAVGFVVDQTSLLDKVELEKVTRKRLLEDEPGALL